MISKINSTPLSYEQRCRQQYNTPSFKGIEAPIAALKWLSESPALGACAVDLGSMVIPRTITDMKNRGVDAGTETGIREGSSTANHLAVGAVGMLAAAVTSASINKAHGIKANQIFANNDAIDLFSSIWKESNGSVETYYQKVFDHIEGFNGSYDVVGDDAWVKIKNIELKNDIINTLVKETEKKTPLESSVKKNIVAKLISDTGASNKYRLGFETAAESTSSSTVKQSKIIEDSLDVMVNTATELGRAFKHRAQDYSLEDFAKSLKNTKTKTALLGLAISGAIGASVQPINTYLTKKRTGKEGFVGVEGREPDKTTTFKLMKLAAAGTMGVLAFKTISKKPIDVLNKIQFTNKLPNLNQFKVLYGATIMSRFLSSRDKNELRESTIKDFLGFANWLILGGMVTKVAARIFDKDLINNPINASGSTGIKAKLKWLTKVDVKSYNEVLLENASDKIKQALKNGEKLKFSTLWKEADQLKKIKVGKLALAQIAGYLYSGVILGVGIAKLNIFITNKIEKGKKTVSPPTDSGIKYYAQKNSVKDEVFSKIAG